MWRSAAAIAGATLVACGATSGAVRPAAGDSDGDGVADVVDLCPTQREDVDGVDDWDGCPEFLPWLGSDGGASEDAPDPTLDTDQDGVPDRGDRCVDEPEDKDGFEDTDGCPDLDNDRDRIPDGLDKCRNDPETYNNIDDDDGCPDKGFIKLH